MKLNLYLLVKFFKSDIFLLIIIYNSRFFQNLKYFLYNPKISNPKFFFIKNKNL